MKTSTSIVVLALAGVLSGCASTSGPSAEGGGTQDTSKLEQTGGPAASGVGTGTGQGTPLAGTHDAAGIQRPDMKRSVYYEFDSFEVKPEFRALVESHANWLRADRRRRLTVEGNADERGSREYNVALGQRRAEAVTRMMAFLGVEPQQIEAVSFGAEKPRAAGQNDAAWAENRRSDFTER